MTYCKERGEISIFLSWKLVFYPSQCKVIGNHKQFHVELLRQHSWQRWYSQLITNNCLKFWNVGFLENLKKCWTMNKYLYDIVVTPVSSLHRLKLSIKAEINLSCDTSTLPVESSTHTVLLFMYIPVVYEQYCSISGSQRYMSSTVVYKQYTSIWAVHLYMSSTQLFDVITVHITYGRQVLVISLNFWRDSEFQKDLEELSSVYWLAVYCKN